MADITVTTAKYGTIITAIGKQKIAAAILAGKQVKITHAAVGDGGGAYYKPTEDQTDLIHECWRGEIASYTINESAPNMIDIKFVVPAEVGGFTVREGIAVDEDGDAIAIWNTPDAQKVPITDGVSFPLTMVAHILVEDASAVIVKVNPTLDTVSRDEMDKALKNFADGVGSAVIRDITIPAASWREATADDWTEVGEDPDVQDDYKYMADVALAEALLEHVPHLAFDRRSLCISGEAAVCPTIYALDGIVRLFAEAIPSGDMSGTITLRSENLNYTGGGCECPDTATDEEVQDDVEDVFGESGSDTTPDDDGSSGEEGPTESDIPDGYTVATDEEVKTEVVEGIFGVTDTVNE